MNANARFFQENIQKNVIRTYPIINKGNPKEIRLNQGKIFGGTYAFNKTPNNKTRMPKCRMRTIKRKIFTII